ncbi:DUF2931 family protein [Ornithobacterium rhinotracheale]|uniref:DUF2931 family protein n=1 Tax=Ornithobacterium rhinotracheale (strain ATCC 51463 / DSM 15997 / CCUG 23171 / CIP 104009 / LMG 9086) TaxID=867902 RepID=I4A1S1_ORNRL|nr:DUF2931 family protein [Ornithobacterium rhinotracheale]AFL97905.1 Protein of unknown function (DUF2931) [Ornithobacterium rhinotracheale DSM 15997]AIP99716.1 hypothetical protein Q785_08600 [Ornithobacterium rhinotracheale ORT-UMN 88]KGB66211.1 hypothetical protein Q787_08415 [Ornithobacterium rhinotracheale H06-030791]MCK0193803.1 DUF2931 family protein [Ornithobacterium rhinotracheale]UOH63851.1 DUF2931 family protein [Ornithobacterium rhinotracheale]
MNGKKKKAAPLGYPVEVYRGGFETKEGYFRSLVSGITTGKHGWGYGGGGMSSYMAPIPDHLHTIWFSYAESCFYEVDTEIDKAKMLALFREGYDWLDANGKIRPDNYNEIIAGFAPGGVVVVWVAGATQQVEIGRYQGRKIVIPQEEIDALPQEDKLLFDKENQKEVMEDSSVIPQEIIDANKNKPIPYGLWDIYRKKYPWRLVFKFRGEVIKLDKKSMVRIELVNGERFTLFHDNFPLKQFFNKSIPKNLYFGWRTEDNTFYEGNCSLDETAILSAFKEIFSGNNKDITADLVISVNQANTYFIVRLVGSNGKEVVIPTPEIEVYKPIFQD